ncbi:MAG: hypothetical protein ABI678_30615 [Kofleriaceae bacterium]
MMPDDRCVGDECARIHGALTAFADQAAGLGEPPGDDEPLDDEPLDPPLLDPPPLDPPLLDPPLLDPPLGDPPLVDPPLVPAPVPDPLVLGAAAGAAGVLLAASPAGLLSDAVDSPPDFSGLVDA